jgi:hypothetical protein
MAMRLIALLLAVCLLGSCAGLPTAGSDPDEAAKAFRASEGKAAIYIIPSFSDSEVTVTMDGRKVGRLVPAQFLLLDVPPGRHVLFVTFAGLIWEALPREKSDDLTMDVEAGQCVFLRTIWTEENRKWSHPRIYLERMKEEEGRQAVLVRTYTPPLK